MPYDFSDFAQKTPYASELFGVYQPLFGWRSNSNKQRVSREGALISREIIQQVANDLKTRPDLQLDRRNPVEDAALSSLVNNALGSAVSQFMTTHGRVPNEKDWDGIVQAADFQGIALATPALHVDAGLQRIAPLGLTLASKASLSAEQLASRTWHPVTGTELLIARDVDLPSTQGISQQETDVRSLQLLSKHAPMVLQSLFKRYSQALANWQVKLNYVDPLANFDGDPSDAILSPIGVLHLFREYFFEGKSFPGPAVGHVWLSPGSSLELYEVHTRKRLEDQKVEVGLETTRKSETSTTEQDELSNAVSDQNSRNTNLGVTASGGVNFGVVQSSTSASFSLGQTQQSSQQTARKHMRQQTDKLSSEIKQSIQTSFRTSTEVDDTESRRYLLNNTTDKLVNYELRRKMRRVGVQVQRLGAQLCWQIYVDDPGVALAIPELVHVAKPSDLDSVPPPEAPPPLEDKESDLSYQFPFDSGIDDRNSDDNRYNDGIHPPDISFFPPLKIVHRRLVKVLPPEPGYEVATVNLVSIDRIDPQKDQPSASIHFELGTSRPRDRFWVVLDQVNFHTQPALQLSLKIGWAPTDDTKKTRDDAYLEQQKDFAAEKARAAYVAYVEAVRDRIKLAGQVARRPSDDLREEERTIVYRRLIEKLTGGVPADTPAERHVVAELVGSLFDVDRMLYFVAPEWWKPRRPFIKQNVTNATPDVAAPIRVNDGTIVGAGAVPSPPEDRLLPSNRVSWGGTGGGRETYLVTEDSAPAPLGASLGWVLQLDGDAHRNAFLNTPWVKAVIPITRGRESAAIRWLRMAHVEGDEGLDQPIPGGNQTVEAALGDLANQLSTDDTQADASRAEDRLFENGFDPLEGGTRLQPFPVFDSWVEVMPTDQVIALEYVAEQPS